jgi:hypothetical protein
MCYDNDFVQSFYKANKKLSTINNFRDKKSYKHRKKVINTL